MVTVIQLALLVQLLAAQPPSDAAPYIRIDRLSPRVILAYWPGIDRRCTLTALQSEKGLVMIDTEASPAVMAPIKQKIEQTLGRSDWAYVINTHAHDNHCSGNGLFKGAVIVGHENLLDDMGWLFRRQTDPNWKRAETERYTRILDELRVAQPRFPTYSAQARLIRSDLVFYDLLLQDLLRGFEVVPPTVTFADKYTLDLGDLTLELVFFGKGHSNSDILIHVPREKLLVSGAIAYQQGHLPEIGEQSTLADVHRFIAVLDGLLAPGVKIDHVIPGHSPPLTGAVLPPIRDYYQRMLTEVQAARRQGLTLDQTISRLTIRAKFPAFRDPLPGTYGYGMQERNVKNLWRILDEPPQPTEPNKP
jgi:glyoxylase-like metal-dependent hydrolase (beta-lactamase superfamily II)